METILDLKGLITLLLLALLVYRYLVYPAFVGPLARIPAAHWTARVSPAWILWKRYSFQVNRAIHTAHAKHGDVVRLGPNELSVNCVDDGLRTIYAGGFEKHQWYPNLFRNYDGVQNMFSTAGSKSHAQRKRLMSNVYAKSSVQSSQGFAIACQQIVQKRLLPSMRMCSETDRSIGRVDLYRLFGFATMDLVTAYMFGLKSSSNFIQNPEAGEMWLKLYGSRKQYVFWPQEFPRITNLLYRIGIRVSPAEVGEANHELGVWCLQMCERADNCTDGNSTCQPQDVPNVYQQLKEALHNEMRKGSDMPVGLIEAARTPRLSVASDMLDQLSAGHETSSITLTYLFYELILNQKLQDRLREELLTCFNAVEQTSQPDVERKTLPSCKDLDALPLLHAVLLETLRLHTAIPGSQPRITPAAKAGQSVKLGSFYGIPPNVRVSAQAYSLHRNPSVFPDPERFDPERWLTKDEARKVEMMRWFWAFSSGGRMCIGSHLAMLQMKLLIANLIVNFRILRVVDDNPEGGGIEQEDEYTATPKGERLTVEFALV